MVDREHGCAAFASGFSTLVCTVVNSSLLLEFAPRSGRSSPMLSTTPRAFIRRGSCLKEFPVSSLGHSVLLPALAGGRWAKDLNVSAPESPYLAFIVGLHVATAAAAIGVFLA